MLNSASVSASRSAPRSDLRREEFGSKSKKKQNKKNHAIFIWCFSRRGLQEDTQTDGATETAARGRESMISPSACFNSVSRRSSDPFVMLSHGEIWLGSLPSPQNWYRKCKESAGRRGGRREEGSFLSGSLWMDATAGVRHYLECVCAAICPGSPYQTLVLLSSPLLSPRPPLCDGKQMSVSPCPGAAADVVMWGDWRLIHAAGRWMRGGWQIPWRARKATTSARGHGDQPVYLVKTTPGRVYQL